MTTPEHSHLATHKSPTPTSLEEGVENMLEAVRTIKRFQHEAPPLQPTARRQDDFLSFAQQRVWFLHRLAPESPAFNKFRAYRITGPLDIATFEKALNETVRRHEILRTTFPSVNWGPGQLIAPPSEASLRIVALDALSESAWNDETLKFAHQECQRPFDLAKGPLVRVTLIRLRPTEHVLLVTKHQIITDGQSWKVFNKEIATLYDAFHNGRPSPLDALPIQYADFAQWQRQWLQGSILERQLTYWKHQLDHQVSGSQVHRSSREHVSTPIQGIRQYFKINRSLTRALKTLSKQEGMTLFVILLSALMTLLHRHTLQEDILVLTSSSGRNHPKLRRLIGLFANILALRTNLSHNMSFRKLLNQVREVTLGAHSHQDVPYEQVVEHLHVKHGINLNPQAQVLFILQNEHYLQIPRLTVTPLDVVNELTKLDLTLFLSEKESGLSGWLRYRPDRYHTDTIVRLLNDFETLLKNIVSSPQHPLSTLLPVAHPTLLPKSPPAVRDDANENVAREQPRFVAPQNQVEKTIATIVQNVLGVREVSIRQNLFDLGVHSLLLAQILTQVQKTFSQHISLVEMFRHSTISALAHYLSHGQGEQSSFQQVHERAEQRRLATRRQQQLVARRKQTHA